MRKIGKGFLVVFLMASGWTVAQAEPVTLELVFQTSQSVKKGREALQMGRIDEAVTYFERALEYGVSRNELRSLHNDLCVAYFYPERFEKAMEHCNKAINMAPNRWRPYNNRGNIYVELGDYVPAIKDYEKALKMSGGDELVQRNLEIAVQRAEEARDLELIRDVSEARPEEQQLIVD